MVMLVMGGGVNIACSATLWIDKDGRPRPSRFRKIAAFISRIPKDKKKQFAILMVDNFAPGNTIFAKASFLSQLLPIPDFCVWHDVWFGLNAASQGGILFVKKPLVLYRRHPSQVTSGAKAQGSSIEEEMRNAKRARRKWLEDVQSNVSLSKECLRIIQSAIKLNERKKKRGFWFWLYVFRNCGVRYFLFCAWSNLKKTCARLHQRKKA